MHTRMPESYASSTAGMVVRGMVVRGRSRAPARREYPPRMRTGAAILLAALGGCGGESAGGGGDGDGDGGAPVAPALDTMRLAIDGRALRDDLGRAVTLRGVNAGGRAKFPPFFPFAFAESGFPGQEDAPPFEAAAGAYFDRVVAWGGNAVRLPFTWEAVEPTRGAYDETFLDRYEAMVESCAERGVRVIVDMHQDVYARPYCGDGFPLWSLPEPVPETPDDCSMWFIGYIQAGPVQDAFDRFWQNEDGLRDAFGAMWREMAARLWPHDNVAGFEIINEPGWGTMNEDEFERDMLTPFYGEMAAAVREVAPGAPIFFDATGFDAIEAMTAVELPDGGDMVFAPHYYSPALYFGGAVDPADVAEAIGRWEALAAKWGVPALLGEFGAQRELDVAVEYVRANFDALDAFAMHGTLWEYSATPDEWNAEGMSIVDAGGEETVVAAEVVRAYPRAVAGDLSSFTYDAVARAGTLAWAAEAGGVTEIAAPARLYPEGVDAVLDGVAGAAEWDGGAGAIVVRTDEAGAATLAFAPAGGT